MGGILSAITEVFRAIAAFFGYRSKKIDVDNAPDVRAAAVGKQEAAAVDKTTQAVANRDTCEIRKELSE